MSKSLRALQIISLMPSMLFREHYNALFCDRAGPVARETLIVRLVFMLVCIPMLLVIGLRYLSGLFGTDASLTLLFIITLAWVPIYVGAFRSALFKFEYGARLMIAPLNGFLFGLSLNAAAVFYCLGLFISMTIAAICCTGLGIFNPLVCLRLIGVIAIFVVAVSSLVIFMAFLAESWLKLHARYPVFCNLCFGISAIAALLDSFLGGMPGIQTFIVTERSTSYLPWCVAARAALTGDTSAWLIFGCYSIALLSLTSVFSYRLFNMLYRLSNVTRDPDRALTRHLFSYLLSRFSPVASKYIVDLCRSPMAVKFCIIVLVAEVAAIEIMSELAMTSREALYTAANFGLRQGLFTTKMWVQATSAMINPIAAGLQVSTSAEVLCFIMLFCSIISASALQRGGATLWLMRVCPRTFHSILTDYARCCFAHSCVFIIPFTYLVARSNEASNAVSLIGTLFVIPFLFSASAIGVVAGTFVPQDDGHRTEDDLSCISILIAMLSTTVIWVAHRALFNFIFALEFTVEIYSIGEGSIVLHIVMTLTALAMLHWAIASGVIALGARRIDSLAKEAQGVPT